MSNIALYRKWRPKTFLDVVEQEHVVKTLRNSLVRGRLAHAYLFCGTRGTGKTTLAHILSRAANCLSPKDGDPCNECEICTGILSGRIMDVVEIDAASNNSVDNIRRLRDDIVYAPAQARYKVYIIDEVHMLSGGAFNALLKTLEEPPEYAIFILATTEPHKLPATILSRCQRFDFRRISNDAIAARLAVVAEGAGAAAEADALLLIAKLADGALRDAISILDQCISTGAETLTRDVVMRTCGIADDAFLCESARILADGDVAAIPEHVAALAASGRGLSQYIGGLTGFFRNLMVLKFGRARAAFPEIQDDTFQIMSAMAGTLDLDRILAIIGEFAALENAIKVSANQSILLEITLAKLCMNRYRSDTAVEALGARIAGLERKVEELERVASVRQQPAAGVRQQPTIDEPSPATARADERAALPQPEPQEVPSPHIPRAPSYAAPEVLPQPEPQAAPPPLSSPSPAAAPSDGSKTIRPVEGARWREVANHFKQSGDRVIAALLQSAPAYARGDSVIVALPSEKSGFIGMLTSGENAQKLRLAVQKTIAGVRRVQVLTEREFTALDTRAARLPNGGDGGPIGGNHGGSGGSDGNGVGGNSDSGSGDGGGSNGDSGGADADEQSKRAALAQALKEKFPTLTNIHP